MGGWAGALGSIANTAGNWGATPSGGAKQPQSQSGAWVASQQAAKKIADTIKNSGSYTDDAGMSDTIHSKKHSKKDAKKHAKTCNKKHTHKKGVCK